MIKRRLKSAFVVFLLTVFVVFKWSPSHAHLNAQHDHGGEQHQHTVETHAHQSAHNHSDNIDFNHSQMDEGKVVNLDHEQCTQNDKTQDNPALSAFSYCLPLTHSGRENWLVVQPKSFASSPLSSTGPTPRTPSAFLNVI